MVRHRNAVPEYPSIWADHVNIYCKVFACALQQLQRTPVSGNENRISEHLYPLLKEECFQLKQAGYEIRPPQWEGPQPPETQNEVSQEHVGTRPDFTCPFLDTSAETLEEWSIPLHVECKRLGKRTSPSWILNENYVTKGIARFDLASHKYGNRASSGMMIGYIISMEPEDILKHVNSRIEENLAGVPPLAFALSAVPLQSQQRFARRHVTPRDFTLIHLWVDIRNNYE